MNLIASQFNKLNNKHSLFSIQVSFDWYDGFVSGLARLRDSNEVYFFNLLSLDDQSGMRIFLLLNVNEEWEKRLSNDSLGSMQNVSKAFFLQYTGKCYLFQAVDIEAINYNLIEIKKENTKFYDSVEEVMNEIESVKKRWANSFPSPPSE
jgi:hypothetical protein